MGGRNPILHQAQSHTGVPFCSQNFVQIVQCVPMHHIPSKYTYKFCSRFLCTRYSCCSKSLRALSLHIYLVSWTMVHNLLHVCSSMIWLTFCFFFIELSNDSCLLSFFLFFSWTNCLHVFSCPHMCYVAWHLPKDAWKALRKYLTKLPSPPPHSPIGKQEESKREK